MALIALLQRTPVARLVVSAGDFVLESPMGSVLRAAVATAASMGAVHTLAGATTLVYSPNQSPGTATVGTAKTIAFTVNGAESAPASWTVGGSVPPGMTFSGGITSGTVNISTILLSGSPTTAGTYVLSLRAWENPNAQGSSATFSYSVVVSGGTIVAPAITTQPQSQSVLTGSTVTFTVVANGTTPLTYQWNKDGIALSGQTGTSLTIPSANASSAGNYTATVTNSAGSVTSNAANLAVSDPGPPTITTQPASLMVAVGQSATFSVVAAGSGTLSYQWFKGATALTTATTTGTSYTISSVQASDAGSYSVLVSSSFGAVTSNAAVLSVTAATQPPTITAQPQAATVAVGSSASFSVTATGSGTLTYQWTKDGVAISGATKSSYSIASVQATDAGTYAVAVTGGALTTTSSSATLTVTGTGTGVTSRLSNLSVRTTMASGQTLIVGFYVDGGSKDILLRVAGPALTPYVSTPMTDPRMELHDSSSIVGFNDNWSGALASSFAAVGAFPFPDNSKDSALKLTLSGGYSALVTGTGPGTILFEGYDAGSGNTARLINISARNYAGTGDDVLIEGFYIEGTGTKQLLVRGVGPTLSISYGVSGTLADPKVELYDGSGAMIAQNDNWDSSLASKFASVGAFALVAGSKDAAMVVTVAAGRSYSVQVKGADGGKGETLAEVYELK